MPCSIMSSLPVAFHISWEGSSSFFECRIRSRDPGHADLGVILWSGRSRGPPSMSGYATEVVGRNKRRHSPRRIDTSSMWLTHSVMRIEWLLLLVCRHGSVAGSQDISNCRSAFTMPCWMFYNQRHTAWGTWNKQSFQLLSCHIASGAECSASESSGLVLVLIWWQLGCIFVRTGRKITTSHMYTQR